MTEKRVNEFVYFKKRPGFIGLFIFWNKTTPKSHGVADLASMP